MAIVQKSNALDFILYVKFIYELMFESCKEKNITIDKVNFALHLFAHRILSGKFSIKVYVVLRYTIMTKGGNGLKQLFVLLTSSL